MLTAYYCGLTQIMEGQREDSYAMSRAYREHRTEHKDMRVRQVRTPRLTVVKPVPKNRLTPGAVVWAHVPFEDGKGEKTRPAVVVSASSREVVVLPTTTSAKRHRFPASYVELCDLESAGISRPSGVSSRTVTLDRIELVDIVGYLSDEDFDRVMTTVAGTGDRVEVEGAHAA